MFIPPWLSYHPDAIAVEQSAFVANFVLFIPCIIDN